MYAFSPHPSNPPQLNPPPSPTSHPPFFPPLALSVGPLYMFLYDPSPSFLHYPPLPSPLVTVSLFFISMSLVIQFTIAKCWKQPKCPWVNEWIKKLCYIYTMEYYAAERKKELLPFSTAGMERESIMLSEISQVVKDKYHMILPVSGT